MCTRVCACVYAFLILDQIHTDYSSWLRESTRLWLVSILCSKDCFYIFCLFSALSVYWWIQVKQCYAEGTGTYLRQYLMTWVHTFHIDATWGYIWVNWSDRSRFYNKITAGRISGRNLLKSPLDSKVLPRTHTHNCIYMCTRCCKHIFMQVFVW